MKKIYNSVLLLIIIVSCNSTESIEETTSDNINQLEIVNLTVNKNTEINFTDNNIKINFRATKNKNIITSNINLQYQNKDVKILSNTFEFDKNIKSYKLGVFKNIENSATLLKEKLGLELWIKVKNSYEKFIKELTKQVTISEYQTDLIQSSFYQLSILNSIIRSLEENKDCECTPLPAYFVGKSSFWCQEDYFFETSDLLSYYTENKQQLFSLEGGEKEYNYLTTLKQNKVSSKELFSLHNSVENFKSKVNDIYIKDNSSIESLSKNEDVDREDCWSGGLGSDLGCCGNYSGCCWYASLNCLRHDIACLKCDKWHCGPSCAPTIQK
jgi:hypothetical protein